MMAFLGGCLSRIQLFFVAFSLAAGGLMLVGVSQGHPPAVDAQAGLSHRFIVAISDAFPELAAQISQQTGFKLGGPDEPPLTAAATEPPPMIRRLGASDSSLSALHLRQLPLP